MKSLLVFLATVLLVPYQNCSRQRFEGQQAEYPAAKGNGDSYTGKVDKFAYSNPAAPCSQVTRSGEPFPNREIFIIRGAFTLVRDNCSDIVPVPLSDDQITVIDDSTISYQGQTFTVEPDFAQFNVIPLNCPSGRVVNKAAPANLALDPFALDSINWRNHPIPVSLAGSISALPLFQILRDDPNELVDWSRMSQNVPIKSNTDYSYSFLLKAGNVDKASFMYYMDSTGGDIAVRFNLTDGSYTVVRNDRRNFSVVSQRYGSGWNFTVFFNTGRVTQEPDIGVTTYSNSNIQVGDYIYASAARFHEIDSYCAP